MGVRFLPFRKAKGGIQFAGYDGVDDSGGSYDLPVATSVKLGVIKVGDGLKVTDDGTLSILGDLHKYVSFNGTKESTSNLEIDLSELNITTIYDIKATLETSSYIYPIYYSTSTSRFNVYYYKTSQKLVIIGDVGTYNVTIEYESEVES